MPADGIMDTGYQNTLSGLLRKRGEMLASKADLREQIAVLSPLGPRGPPRFALAGFSMACSQRRGRREAA
jgi:hypothetical protein